MSTSAIIVAAGTGQRAGGGTPKQFWRLHGQAVLIWSVAAFAEAGADQIVVAITPDQEARAREALAAWNVQFVHGGATRTASVRAALAATSDADVVLVHDAARPGLTAAMVRILVEQVKHGADAVAPALPLSDTLLRSDGAGRVREAIDRADAQAVQTPQAFRGTVLRAAYAAAGADFTDDLSVVRAHGGAAELVRGDVRLMKLTYPEDLTVIEALMSGDRFTCVGNGVDAHRFGEGDHVTLCGVRIPHHKGLLGHSDADAGWHALVDAILGALGEGDIGAHFPPSDPRWKGADSERFLRHARELAESAGARILHVDVTILCERPKIGPHREAMRARTAEVLGLPIERVSVKATTTERMGFLGREEGLAAQATATLERRR